MVTIQINGGTLDVLDGQAMELEVTAMRFSGGIRDAYTNDLSLPKTKNNIKLLDCYNLLDSPNQLYGSKIQPAVLTVDGYMLDVHLQVVEVTDDEITVCLYEHPHKGMQSFHHPSRSSQARNHLWKKDIRPYRVLRTGKQ